jgi:glutaminase
MTDGPAAGHVTVLDVYAKQIEMNTQLAVIGEQMKTLTTGSTDHETRLRVLEQARARLYGAALALGALAGAAASWVALALSRR